MGSRSDAPAERVRDPYLDNAKCVAILFVVVGHALVMVLDSPAAHSLYLWIYLFHMPVFVFLAGHLSRGYVGTTRQGRAVVTGLLLPYAVFQILYDLQARWKDGDPLGVQYVDPTYVMWFLVSLATWRLLAPVLLAVRWPLFVAVLLSFAAVLSEKVDDTFSLGRTVGFLPFFVAGLLVRREHLAVLTTRPVRALAAVAAGASLALAAIFEDRVDREWLYWRTGFEHYDLTLAQGLTIRAVALAAGAVLGAAFLALIPRRRSVLTALGAGTMTAFLLHGLALRLPPVVDHFRGPSSPVDVAVAALGGLALGLVLLLPPVRRVFKPLVEPPVGRFVVRRD